MEECMRIAEFGRPKSRAVRITGCLLTVMLVCCVILGGAPLDFEAFLSESDRITEISGESADSERNAGFKAMEMDSLDGISPEYSVEKSANEFTKGNGIQESDRPDLLSEAIPEGIILTESIQEEGLTEMSAVMVLDEERMDITTAVEGKTDIITVDEERTDITITDEERTDLTASIDLERKTEDMEIVISSDEEFYDGLETEVPIAPVEKGKDERTSNPSESGVEEIVESPVQETPVAESAFVFDEEGMICGFCPEYASITDGVLTLPAEGCTGIRSGAFSGCRAGICEIYIPAAVSVIEEGAFAGLDSLEWIEVETGNPGCCSIDGVLFNKTATVLLAFTNGRIGTYLVPETVTRIGEGAFANTSITALDMRLCGDVTFGGDVFGNASDTVILLMP